MIPLDEINKIFEDTRYDAGCGSREAVARAIEAYNAAQAVPAPVDSEANRASFEAEFAKPPYEWNRQDFARFGDGESWPGSYRKYHIRCAYDGCQVRQQSFTPNDDAVSRRLYRAVLSCDHAIDANQVVLHFDAKQRGHNALAQLFDRIKAALSVIA